MVDWTRKVHRETRDIPEGVRLRSDCREKSINIVRYEIAVNPASEKL